MLNIQGVPKIQMRFYVAKKKIRKQTHTWKYEPETWISYMEFERPLLEESYPI